MELLTKEKFNEKVDNLWEECTKDLSKEDKIKIIKLLKESVWKNAVLGDSFK